MLDPKRLLEQFMGSGKSGGRSSAGDILGSLGTLGGSSGGLKERAGQMAGMATSNPMAASAVMAALLGTKTGRKLGGSALKIGGMAAVAGLGYLAYKNYQAGKAPTAIQQEKPQEVLPPPADSGFDIEPTRTSDDFALAMVRAMIAAAKADGHIDANERAAIVGKLSEDGLDAEEMAFLQKELEAPVDLDSIVSAARTDEQKVEIYTASRMAIEPDNRAEKGYLDLLAGRLGLPDALVDHIEATVASSKASA
ncbi:tellurite resistance TerB family protein [Pararhizobium haloflavum]|uniref:tellurite resistance TerB family protein n=1 Tax=Pararhizobium haloflavum TaxID=2037914 RepID=UPI000C18D1E1|nr:tellurite resistance TerB family protein [Pararhizobium haloflavum]